MLNNKEIKDFEYFLHGISDDICKHFLVKFYGKDIPVEIQGEVLKVKFEDYKLIKRNIKE